MELRYALAVLTLGLTVFMAACGPAQNAVQPASQPTASPVRSITTATVSPEPTPDAFAAPRATVTAFFEEHDPPFKPIYIHHLESAYWKAGNTSGVYGWGWNKETQQLVFHVETERSKRLIEEQATSIGIPSSMLLIDVPAQIQTHNPPVNTSSALGVDLSLAIKDQILTGKSTTFHIELENTSDRPIELEVGNPPSVDVIVLSMDGDQVWRHQPPLRVGTGESMVLDVGQVSRIPVVWDLVDDDGFSLEPGEYLVRGMADFSEVGIGRYVPINLATAAVPFALTAAD